MESVFNLNQRINIRSWMPKCLPKSVFSQSIDIVKRSDDIVLKFGEMWGMMPFNNFNHKSK